MIKNLGLINDLHLEGSNLELHNPGWDYLVIAGDLSADLKVMQHFFAYHAPSDIPVIYVLGNHEYEGRRLDSTVEQIREMTRHFENVFVLDNESIQFDGVKFIGSTLWSNFELDGLENKKEAMKWAKMSIVDFTYIFDKNETGQYVSLTPEKMVKMNEEACRFLEFELKNNPYPGSKVVVTHFAPHPNSVHIRHQGQQSSYWVNNLEHLMGFSDYWLHGHTHNSFNYEVEGTKVVCNPRGYSKVFNMSSNSAFNRELILPLDVPDLNLKKSFKP
jgi:Icc-related predicted phosphoesterase